MKCVRFMHIPKTAGNSFNSVLYRQYGRGRYFTLNGDPAEDSARFRTLDARRREKIRLFVGHAPIETRLSEADSARVITLLRDPVQRVKSFCQHVAEGKSSYLITQFPPDEFDLDTFLASGKQELSNLQTKYLSGLFQVGNGVVNESPVTVDTSDERVLATALRNLTTRVHCFGLQEYFAESLIEFAAALEWRRMPTYYVQNTRNRRRLLEFKERHVRRIEELNALDVELYKAAKRLFVDRIAAPTFSQKRLAALRRWNRLPPVVRRAATVILTGEY